MASPNQLLECDIVMAGGVTSGIIYPGAVAVISRRYSFRSIGGTSVGAIAAAVTAAAEYGRMTGRNPTAFDSVGALPKSLGDEATDGHSRLFHLFTPEPSTRPLFALVTPLFGGGGWMSQILRIFKACTAYWLIGVPTVVALLAGLSVTGALLIYGRLELAILAVLALVMTAAFALVVWLGTTAFVLVRTWLPAWRQNGYGICTGLASPECRKKDDSQADFESLTCWMHRTVQAAAGRGPGDPPLTFGELWTAPSGLATTTAVPNPTAPRSIELAMIASDISRNRTVQLPFLEAPSPLYIETDVLDRYFPTSIAEWMKRKAGEYEKDVDARRGVVRLPSPQDLPIVFGARLSLSFPVLLTALPLMTPDYAEGKNGVIPLRPVWFSDGGLTSNFPIHFFDSPIPTRPTFCLNLIDFDGELPSTSRSQTEQARAESRTAARRPETRPERDPGPGDEVWGFVSMTKGDDPDPAPFTAFDEEGAGVGSFFSTLVNTARAWSDNQLLMAPGVRDRVVNIALREDEGGLNLDMKPSVIADLDWRGRAAGLLISARFDPAQQKDPETGEQNKQRFANHRWVRFRNFMASFEDVSRRFAHSRRASDKTARERGEACLDDMMAGNAVDKIVYPVPEAAKVYYRETTDALEQLALTMAATTRADQNATFDHPRGSEASAPRPKMRSRLRPIVDNDPRSEAADLPDPLIPASGTPPNPA